MKIKSILFALCLGMSLAAPAMAAGNPLYLGVKGGKMMVDLSEYEDVSTAGLVVGYKLFDNQAGSVAVEGEYTNSSTGDITVLGVTGQWDIDTWALYAAYRTPGNLYAKAKAGVLHEKINVNIVGAGISGSDSGLSLGVGGGLRLGRNAALELEYTIVEQDVNFASLGVNLNF
jgi:Outer membrane protein beta-barrel domain